MQFNNSSSSNKVPQKPYDIVQSQRQQQAVDQNRKNNIYTPQCTPCSLKEIQIKDFKQKLEQTYQEYDELKKQLQQRDNQIKESEQKYKAQEQKVLSLENKIQETSQLLQNNETKFNTYQTQSKTTETSLQQQIDSLNTEISQKNNTALIQQQQLQSKFDKLVQLSQNQKKELQESKENINTTNQKLIDTQNQLQLQENEKKKKIQELEQQKIQQKSDKDKEIQQLTQELANLKTKTQQETNQILVLNTAIQTLTRNLNDQKAQLEIKQQQMDKIGQEKDSTNKQKDQQIQSISHTNEELQSKLDKQLQINQKNEQQICKLKDELDQFQKDIKDTKNHYQNQVQELAIGQQKQLEKNQALDQELIKIRKQNQQLQKTEDDLKKQINSLQKDNQHLQAKNSQEIDSLHQEQNNKTAKYQKQIQEQQQDISKQRDSFKKETDELIQNQQKKQEEIQRELDNKKKTVSVLEIEIKEKLLQIQTLESDKKLQQLQIEKAQQAKQDFDIQIDDIKKDLQRIRQEREELLQDKQNLVKQNLDQQSNIRSLENSKLELDEKIKLFQYQQTDFIHKQKLFDQKNSTIQNNEQLLENKKHDLHKIIDQQEIQIKQKDDQINYLESKNKDILQSVQDNIIKETIKVNNEREQQKFDDYDIMIYFDSLMKITKPLRIAVGKGVKADRYTDISTQPCYIVSFLGAFNSGKTHLVSKLTNKNFTRGLDQRTQGFNFVFEDQGQNKSKICYIDVKGCGEPLRVYKDVIYNHDKKKTELDNKIKQIQADPKNLQENQENNNVIKFCQAQIEQINQKNEILDAEFQKEIDSIDKEKDNIHQDAQLSERFIQDFSLENSDIIIIAVGILRQDTEAINYQVVQTMQTTTELSRKIIIVVHNFFELETIAAVQQNIKTDIIESFNGQDISNEKTTIFKVNSLLLNPIVHLVMAKEGTEAGDKYNQATLDHLKGLIQDYNRADKNCTNVFSRFRQFLSKKLNDYIIIETKIKQDLLKKQQEIKQQQQQQQIQPLEYQNDPQYQTLQPNDEIQQQNSKQNGQVDQNFIFEQTNHQDGSFIECLVFNQLQQNQLTLQNQIFDFWGRPKPQHQYNKYSPSYQIYKTNDGYCVILDISGCKPGDLKPQLQTNETTRRFFLTIVGKRSILMDLHSSYQSSQEQISGQQDEKSTSLRYEDVYRMIDLASTNEDLRRRIQKKDLEYKDGFYIVHIKKNVYNDDEDN